MPEGNATNDRLRLTDNAARRIAEICMAEGNNALMLRLTGLGGGCSGFQYIWGLSKEATHETIQWSKPIDDILLLDPMAEMYVLGSEIDYVEELGASFLKLVNPTATSHCGCGESFGI